MFLSKLEVNPMRRQSRRLLSDPQAMHAVIMKTCNPNEGERILWRIDETDSSIDLYIVSPQTPDVHTLNDQIGWENQDPESADYDGLLNSLENDQKYAFRLTANPTHVSTENGVKKRYGHVTIEQQKNWFLRKASQHGFKIRKLGKPEFDDPHDLVVHDRKVKTFRRQGKTVTLNVASFSGSLEVTDAELLRTALVMGIGRAKAYGCGLLTLARLS